MAAPLDRAIAFIGVHLVPMDRDRVLEDHTVIVRGDRIAEIGPREQVVVPSDAVRIDAREKFLMPGLVDMHVHTYHKKDLLLYIANGVTTVRDMHGRQSHRRWRREVERGELLGPTFYACPTVRYVRGLRDAEDLVAGIRREGFDCVKLYSPPDWSLQSYKALAAAVRKEGLRLVGHLPRNLPLGVALESGQLEISHVEEYLYAYFFKYGKDLGTSRISQVARETAAAGVTVVPTLFVYHVIGLEVSDAFEELLRWPELKYLPESVRRNWGPGRNPYRKRFRPREASRLIETFQFLQKLTKSLHEAGVRLLFGTDTSRQLPFVIPGFSVHRELAELVAIGLTPYQALEAATRNAAEFLGGEDEFGTVEVGKRADLILLEGNPLEDVSNVARRAGVMLRGRWFSEADLQEELAQLARSYRLSDAG